MWQPPSLINSLQTGVYQPPQLIKPLQKGISTPTHVFGVNRGIASMRQFQSAGISDITAIEKDRDKQHRLRFIAVRTGETALGSRSRDTLQFVVRPPGSNAVVGSITNTKIWNHLKLAYQDIQGFSRERDVNTRRTLRLQDIREKVELKRYGDLNIHLKDPEAGYGIAIMATREGVKHYLDTGENPAPHYRAIEEENIEPAVATPEQEEIIAITEV